MNTPLSSEDLDFSESPSRHRTFSHVYVTIYLVKATLILVFLFSSQENFTSTSSHDAGQGRGYSRVTSERSGHRYLDFNSRFKQILFLKDAAFYIEDPCSQI